MKVTKSNVDSVTELVEVVLFSGNVIKIYEKDDGSFVMQYNNAIVLTETE